MKFERFYKGYNNYPASVLRPCLVLDLSAGYVFNEKWETSFKFRFTTENQYAPFNSESLTLVTYIGIQNIYNNKNSNSIRWDYRKGAVDKESSIGL